MPSPHRLRKPCVFGLMGILLMLLVSACRTGEDAPPYDCLRTPPLSYENFGKGFLERNCTGCHSSYLVSPEERNYAPLSVNLNTYADAVQWWERIEARTITDLNMPPAGGLLDADLEQLGEWLYCSVKPDAEALQEESP